MSNILEDDVMFQRLKLSCIFHACLENYVQYKFILTMYISLSTIVYVAT